jgi:hypothetical protein
VAIFRLCPLKEAIQIIESILNKQKETPDSDLDKHIQAVHDSDAKSIDDKHDGDDGKILQQQTSKDESDAKSHDEHAVTDETIENDEVIDEVIGTEITAIFGDTNQMMVEPNQILSKFSPSGPTQLDENDLLTTKREKKEEIPMRKLHKNVCQICGSTFQTVQEITKHIAGNLHDFCIQMCLLFLKLSS